MEIHVAGEKQEKESMMGDEVGDNWGQIVGARLVSDGQHCGYDSEGMGRPGGF